MWRTTVDKRNMKNDYLVLMDLDFSWKKEEVEEIIKFVGRGATIKWLSNRFKREGDEVILLLLDLARKGKIEPEHNIFE